jgi:hypothetical protein|tara:strand:+ start:818 stop:1048 length:231 start_codon:yes stop_codon:yes gene_type:complete
MNDIPITKVTNEIAMIKGIEENLNYIRWLLNERDELTETAIAESLSILVSNMRNDIDRQDKREAIKYRKDIHNVKS